MTNERWLKWATARYYRSHGYKIWFLHEGRSSVAGCGLTTTRNACFLRAPHRTLIRFAQQYWLGESCLGEEETQEGEEERRKGT